MAVQYVGTQSFFICREKRNIPSYFRLGVNTALATMVSLIEIIHGKWFQISRVARWLQSGVPAHKPVDAWKTDICATQSAQWEFSMDSDTQSLLDTDGWYQHLVTRLERNMDTDSQTLEASWCKTRFLLSKLLIHQSPVWKLSILSYRTRFKLETSALWRFNSMKFYVCELASLLSGFQIELIMR